VFKKVLIIDNYDSFTHNLYHYCISVENTKIDIVKNDLIDFESIELYDKIILSPGPGLPNTSGMLMEFINKFHDKKTILGVCLGHQALAQYFGATLLQMALPLHGVATTLEVVNNSILFQNLPKTFSVARYHSWTVDPQNFPKELEITALDINKNILAIKHKYLPIFGVQFHPESILSEYGKEIIKKFILL
jgi:anthranilate synthase component II